MTMNFTPVSTLRRSNVVKSHRFTANPFTDLLVEVVIHPTDKCLNACYHSGKTDDAVFAFCESSDIGAKDEIVARLHFSRDTLCAPFIAHEAYHACETIRLHQRLVGNGDYVQEILAETAERIVSETMKLCRHWKIKVAKFSHLK